MFPSQERIAGQISHLVGVHHASLANIRPHFFLTGPSGTGKSFLTKQICERLELPFFVINAAQLTAEGLSGNSLSKALRPLRENWNKPNVILVDEFDKLFKRNGEDTDSFRSQVQDEFLDVLEAKNASVFTDYGKYEPVLIENTMFIFAGAFSGVEMKCLDDLRDAGMRTEFLGRVPLVFSTQAIPMDELRAALPHIQLFKDYMFLNKGKYKLTKVVADICKLMNAQIKNADLGVRLLHSVIHQYFMKGV